ncbi:hypothetical protein ELS19_19815 [Halogeometricum borinquense]|uniref:Uncharacterized protein n=1 Tax=Halogeometricum borinquense TaxID=60847 RepID=A0A482T5B9_9EURY|nr:hypothetical protein [Halogeometricum borinquense]RYJ07765.1 hypothetical protein ELS19_19815 [Halogeometricum borinquense]
MPNPRNDDPFGTPGDADNTFEPEPDPEPDPDPDPAPDDSSDGGGGSSGGSSGGGSSGGSSGGGSTPSRDPPGSPNDDPFGTPGDASDTHDPDPTPEPTPDDDGSSGQPDSNVRINDGSGSSGLTDKRETKRIEFAPIYDRKTEAAISRLEEKILSRNSDLSRDDLEFDVNHEDDKIVAGYSDEYKRELFREEVLSERPALEEDDIKINQEDGKFVAEYTDAYEGPDYENSRSAYRRGAFGGTTERTQRQRAEIKRKDAVEDSLDNLPGLGVGETEFAQDRDTESDRTRLRQESADNIPGLKEQQNDQRREKRQKARHVVAKKATEKTGVEYDPSDVTVTRNEDGSYSVSIEEKEAFDMDWSFGLGDEKDEVENAIDDAAAGYQQTASDIGRDLFSRETAGESLGNAVLSAAGKDELGEQYDEKVRSVGSTLVTTGASLGNVPGLVGSAMEGGEVVAAAANEATTPGNQEFLSKTENRSTALGEQVYEQAKENPLETGTALAGSLLASHGIMSMASRIGPRAGAAARWTIQPGEELLGAGGHAATKAASGSRTADKLFPNKEPLIFSEEAALSAGKEAATKARNLDSSRLRQEMKSAQFKTKELLRSDAPTRVNTDINTRISDSLRQEMKSARFKAEELVRSDGPTDLDVSRVSNSLRQEMKSAQFKAAETKSKAEDKLSSVRQRASDFNSDDRAQAQIPRPQRRNQDLDTSEGPRTIEPELDSSPRGGLETDARTRTRLETNLSDGIDDRPMDVSQDVTRPELDIGRNQRNDGQPSLTHGNEFDFRNEFDFGNELDFKSELDLGNELDLESEFDLGNELDLGSELNAGMELDQELEQEFGFETEQERESEREFEFGSGRDPFGGGGFGGEFDDELFDTGIQDVEDFLNT